MPLIFSNKYKIKQFKEQVLLVMNMLGIADLARRKVRKLSGGQRQRVAIARAIVNDPDVVFADEPTSALDRKTAQELMGVFKDLQKKGKTIIIVTHDKNVADCMGRTIVIADGKIEEKPL